MVKRNSSQLIENAYNELWKKNQKIFITKHVSLENNFLPSCLKDFTYEWNEIESNYDETPTKNDSSLKQILFKCLWGRYKLLLLSILVNKESSLLLRGCRFSLTTKTPMNSPFFVSKNWIVRFLVFLSCWMVTVSNIPNRPFGAVYLNNTTSSLYTTQHLLLAFFTFYLTWRFECWTSYLFKTEDCVSF